MLLQQKPAVKRTVSNGDSKPIFPRNRQIDSASQAERLLRDMAFVLHATAQVRREMEAEQVLCSAAS